MKIKCFRLTIWNVNAVQQAGQQLGTGFRLTIWNVNYLELWYHPHLYIVLD
ncbi:TPA: hypothetical protein ACMWB8_002219 [Clostridioides difficile]|nr:hypothetical protein [Clostridioides difficile]MDE3446265.1 hypothetical protein [Clostridioides difficile]MDV9488015.1 hypothetical protein [Clostridioides difficile]